MLDVEFYLREIYISQSIVLGLGTGDSTEEASCGDNIRCLTESFDLW